MLNLLILSMWVVNSRREGKWNHFWYNLAGCGVVTHWATFGNPVSSPSMSVVPQGAGWNSQTIAFGSQPQTWQGLAKDVDTIGGPESMKLGMNRLKLNRIWGMNKTWHWKDNLVHNTQAEQAIVKWHNCESKCNQKTKCKRFQCPSHVLHREHWLVSFCYSSFLWLFPRGIPTPRRIEWEAAGKQSKDGAREDRGDAWGSCGTDGSDFLRREHVGKKTHWFDDGTDLWIGLVQ